MNLQPRHPLSTYARMRWALYRIEDSTDTASLDEVSRSVAELPDQLKEYIAQAKAHKEKKIQDKR